MSDRGTLFVYSGPSGVGKGTILAPYLSQNPRAALSVSMTTRHPRPGERDGVEYSFVTRERFEAMIEAGGFLEHASYSGNYYGTPRAAVEEQLARGIDVILEIEVQGAQKIRKSFPEAVFIFVLPPSYEALKARLMGRGTEEPVVMETRLRAAREELSHAKNYDFAIVNDNVEVAREKLAAIITAAKCETRFMKNLIDKVSD